jgi:hypothetical protein
MPYAPQSVKGEYHHFGLFVGLFLFVVFELVSPLFESVKEQYRDNRLLVQYVEGSLRQFEIKRMTSQRRED